MKTYWIKEKRRMKASGRKVTKIPIKDMTSLILMTSLWIKMIDNQDIFYSYLGAEILFPDQDGNKKMAKVIK